MEPRFAQLLAFIGLLVVIVATERFTTIPPALLASRNFKLQRIGDVVLSTPVRLRPDSALLRSIVAGSGAPITGAYYGHGQTPSGLHLSVTECQYASVRDLDLRTIIDAHVSQTDTLPSGAPRCLATTFVLDRYEAALIKCQNITSQGAYQTITLAVVRPPEAYFIDVLLPVTDYADENMELARRILHSVHLVPQ